MAFEKVVTALTAERDAAAKVVTKLDAAIAALSNGTGAGTLVRKKRQLSRAAIARISAAQKSRWAKWKRQQKRAK